MDTLGSPMAFDLGVASFPSLHFTVRNGELEPSYSNSGGGLMYDSPRAHRKPKLQKQSSLDETNKKKFPNLHSPPMKKKSLSSSPPIIENEELVDDFVNIKLKNDKKNEKNDPEKENVEPTSEKKKNRRVSFADAVGLQLTQVQIFEEPEYVLPAKVKEPEPELKDLELTAPLPAMDSEIFKSRFEKNHIIVEKISLGTVNIAGRIRIKALPEGSEPRRVSVRYTKDGWMSFVKQPAKLMQSHRVVEKLKKENKKGKGSEPEPYDLYCFEMGVDRHSRALQFYVSSCNSHGKAEFEDLNEGETYTIMNPNYVEPPEEDDEEAGWDSWMNEDTEWSNDYY